MGTLDSDTEIIKKSVKKANANGYKYIEYYEISSCLMEGYERLTVSDIIYSHDFAKAFWGDSVVHEELPIEEWKHHLKILVLQEDPIEYLKQFL